MKEIILSSDENIQIAINHYNSLKRKSVIIVCPGCFVCKDAASFLQMSEELFRDFDVITMDFRGHGRSTGLFTFTAEEPNDLQAVVKFAKKQYSKIGILGFSLGAATAIIYTSEHKDIQSIIAVSAPTDFGKIENHFLKKEAVVPAIENFEFGKSLSLRPGNIFLEKIKPINVVGEISPIPILFITGSSDPIVHPWHANELYKKAKEPKAIENFDKGLHAEELYLKMHNRFITLCKDWFDRTMAQSHADLS